MNFNLGLFTVIVLSCFVAISLAEKGYEELDLESAWGKYKSDFNKSYPDEVENAKRKELFKKNLELIKDHNKKYEQGLVTYKMGVNKFADWTTEEIQRLLGSGVRPQHDSSAGAVGVGVF